MKNKFRLPVVYFPKTWFKFNQNPDPDPHYIRIYIWIRI
jgi:hypothetical protein